MTGPFFSIIIPAYNRAYILPETIGSITGQTISDWEVVVVDDGSKDDTKAVVNTLSSEDSRIRYVFQSNAERSVARNNGASSATGTYLIFLDSDDSFAPDHLEKLKQFITQKSNPVALIFTNVCYLTENGLKKPELPAMDPNGAFEFILHNPITPSRVCVHRDIFKTFRFDPKIVIVEDQVLWICIASQFRVYHLPEYTSWYRIHEGNSVDLSNNPYIQRIQGLSRLFYHPDYKEIAAKIPDKTKNFLLSECYFNSARHFEYVHNYFGMAGELFKSFLKTPGLRNKERLYMLLSNLKPKKAAVSQAN